MTPCKQVRPRRSDRSSLWLRRRSSRIADIIVAARARRARRAAAQAASSSRFDNDNDAMPAPPPFPAVIESIA